MGRIATALANVLTEKRYVTSPRNATEPTMASMVVSPTGRMGKPSAALYRNWAQNSDLGRALVNFFKRQAATAEWDIVPYYTDRPYDQGLAREIRDLFDTPNLADEGFQGFMEQLAEDLLVLDAGVCELERTFRGDIVYLHAADGARVLVSTIWDGDPDEPRYWWMRSTTDLVSIKNRDLLYMMTNPRTYSPVGLSMFETLKLTIDWELRGASYNAKQVSTATPDGVLDLGEGAKPEQIEYFRCYADDTEFLTERGWLPYDGITADDRLAMVEQASGELHYGSYSERFDAPYSGPMVHLGGKDGNGPIDLLVTPNHRMVVESRHTNRWQISDAADLVGHEMAIPAAPKAWNCAAMEAFTIPQQEWQPGQGARLLRRVEPIPTDLWLEFMGYLISDGWIAAKGYERSHYGLGLAQKIGPKADIIQRCLDQLPFHFYRQTTGGKWLWIMHDKSLWTYCADQIGLGARQKRIPREFLALDRTHLRILFDALVLGDGYRRGTWTKYTSASKGLADDVQEIALKLGYRAGISHSTRGDFQWWDVHVVNRRIARALQIENVDWSGRIVCFTVDTGILVVRRNGKPALCGNSAWTAEVAGNGALAILGGTKGAKYTPFRQGNREMQFMEWQNYLLKKACMVAGVSPQDIGFAMDINRAEGEVQQEISETKGLRPFLATIQNYNTSRIVWDESFGGRKNNLAFRFLRLNISESTDKANINKVALAGVPWKSGNEARIDEGRQPLGTLTDDSNLLNHVLANTPLGMFDLTTGKYVGQVAPEAPTTQPAPNTAKALTAGRTD